MRQSKAGARAIAAAWPEFGLEPPCAPCPDLEPEPLPPPLLKISDSRGGGEAKEGRQRGKHWEGQMVGDRQQGYRQ